MDNPQWREMVEHLFEKGYRRLWSIDQSEMPGNMRFSLECFTTAKGATIFQIWPDRGFSIYTDTSPNQMTTAKKWLTEE